MSHDRTSQAARRALSERDDPVIVVLGSQRWDSIWRSGPKIMCRLAANHRVIFIEPHHDVHESRWRTVARRADVAARLSPEGVVLVGGTRGLPLLRDRLPETVLDRSVPWVMRRNARTLRRHVAAVLDNLNVEADLLWVHGLHHASVLDDHPGPSLFFVYDEFPEFVHNRSIKRPLQRIDDELARTASTVIASSRSQWQRRHQHNPSAVCVPNGVDIDVFNLGVQPHPELAGDRPVIGYAGWLGYQIDVGLLLHVARRFPHARLVLVGPAEQIPDSPELAELHAMPNVEWFGRQPMDELAQYMRGFDVGLIPYRLEGFVLSAYPLKVNEYLACGTAVVATDLPELRAVDAPVTTARSHETFMNAVAVALDDQEDRSTERFEAAARQSWDTRVEQIRATIGRLIS